MVLRTILLRGTASVTSGRGRGYIKRCGNVNEVTHRTMDNATDTTSGTPWTKEG